VSDRAVSTGSKEQQLVMDDNRELEEFGREDALLECAGDPDATEALLDAEAEIENEAELELAAENGDKEAIHLLDCLNGEAEWNEGDNDETLEEAITRCLDRISQEGTDERYPPSYVPTPKEPIQDDGLAYRPEFGRRVEKGLARVLDEVDRIDAAQNLSNDEYIKLRDSMVAEYRREHPEQIRLVA